jgi:hypothetical protein
MKSLETAQILGIASSITAIAALTLNTLWNRRNRHDASMRDRRGFNSEFRRWADLVLMAMSKGMHLWRSGEPIPTALLAEFSALLNSGRLFFLNPSQEMNQNSLDFPGLRPRMLDCIFYTYRFIQMPRTGRDVSEDWEILFRLQARFVRDAQRVMALDVPWSTMEDLRTLLASKDFLDTSATHPAIVAAYGEIERAGR